MILLITLRILTSLVITLFLAASPLFLGLWVIFIALSIALFLAISIASWLGIIIFLIYVGGLLVIFAYFVALTPNLLIEGKTIILILFITYIIVSTSLLIIKLNLNKPFNQLPQEPFTLLLTENLPATIILAIVLFFALVAVVKLCSAYTSPLRPFN